MPARQDGVENRDKVDHKNRFTGTCVFEISRPNQTEIINLVHFCVNKKNTKNNSKYWLFLHNYVLQQNKAKLSLSNACWPFNRGENNGKTLVETARWPLTGGLISHYFLQLFRDCDYWPLNGGWLLNRWPLNGGSTVYRVDNRAERKSYMLVSQYYGWKSPSGIP